MSEKLGSQPFQNTPISPKACTFLGGNTRRWMCLATVLKPKGRFVGAKSGELSKLKRGFLRVCRLNG